MKPVMVWSLAKKAAGTWLRFQLRGGEAARQYLIDSLADLGPGIPAKLNQYLAPISRTPSETTYLDSDNLLEILETESPALLASLKSINPLPNKASLGQVHQGVLKDGRIVAIKFQYPGVFDVIESTLSPLEKTLALIPGMSASQKNNLSLHLSTLRSRFIRELDYKSEALEQNRFYQWFKETPSLKIPLCYRDLSSGTILVQEWCPSKTWNPSDLGELNLSMRQHLARTLLLMILTQTFQHQTLHGDLHPGNLGWTSPTDKNRNPLSTIAETPFSTQLPTLVLYDFGQTLTFDPNHVRIIHAVLQSLRRGLPFNALEAFSGLGFDGEALSTFVPHLRPLFRIFLEPFVCPGDFNPLKWNFLTQCQDLLGPEKTTLRFAGPPWFLILMRTMAGAQKIWSELGVAFPTGDLVENVLGSLTSPIHLTPLPRTGTYKQLFDPPQSITKPLSLHILVTESGTTKVAVEMPSRALENLQDLIPDHVSQALRFQNIDIHHIKMQALQKVHLPQVLFESKVGERTYKVWIG